MSEDIEVVLSQWATTWLGITITNPAGKYPLVEVQAWEERDSGSSSVSFDGGDLSVDAVRAFAQELITKIDAAREKADE